MIEQLGPGRRGKRGGAEQGAHASSVCEQLDLDRASLSASRIGKEALRLGLEGDTVSGAWSFGPGH